MSVLNAGIGFLILPILTQYLFINEVVLKGNEPENDFTLTSKVLKLVLSS